MQPDRTAELARLLDRRILVLDGAMGTMIQQRRLSEADFRGPAACGLARPLARPQGRQRPARRSRSPTSSARSTTRTSRPAPTSSRPTRSRDVDRAGRLRPRGARARDQPRGRGASRASRADALDGEDARPPALRRRRARPDQPHRVDLARRQRSGRAQRHVRRARGRVPRRGRGPGRRRRRTCCSSRPCSTR